MVRGLPAVCGRGQGVGVSAPQIAVSGTVDDLVGQAIRQLVKLDRADLAGAVQEALSRPQHIEVVMVRDSEHATEVEVFVNGHPLRESPQISVAEFDVDPGAGYTWSDWVDSRAADIAAASPAAASALREAALRPWDFIEEMPDGRSEREDDLDLAAAAAARELRGRFQKGATVRQQLRCTCCHRYGIVAEFQPATGGYRPGWWVDWVGGGRTLEEAWTLKEV